MDSESFPKYSLVDVDDIVFKLGEFVVEQINNKKIMQKILHEKANTNTPSQINFSELKESNKKLSQKNQLLADKLKKIREEVTLIKNERDILQKEIDKRNKANESLKEKK
jgi:septal ring factor EnvC (AmiA/AmiB activator)